jgi:ribosomal protein L37E
MSFMDPDFRERLERDGRESRERCQKAGRHEFVGSGERCAVCSVPNPEHQKPRVTLVAGDFRAIFKPVSGDVVIEQRSFDSLGAERWDAIETLSNTHSRSEKSQHHIIALLSKGRAP